MSKILVLPGTMWQLPLMKRIKEMGHELFLVNPLWNEGISNFADHFYEADIFDFEAVLDYCRSNNIDCVMSDECDIATDIVAKYNRAIGARALSEELANLFTNKCMMRDFCLTHNLNPIPFALCENINDAISFFLKHGKSILKPLNSNSSHGVFTISSIADIERNFDESSSFSRQSNSVLIEKYIEGTEFTVDGIMTSNGHKTLAISEKDHYKHNDNIANKLFFSQTSKRFDYTLLRETNNHLLNLTGLPFGITHVEYKYCDGKYYLIEMAARGGGNLISAIISPFMSGIDVYKELINCCLNENYETNAEPDIDNDKISVLKFIDMQSSEGVVKQIKGLDYLEFEQCIKSYKINFGVGDYIHKPESDSVRIGYYIICAKNKREFDKVSSNVEKKLIIDLA